MGTINSRLGFSSCYSTTHFNGRVESIRFKIDMNNLSKSTARISGLSKVFKDQTINWNHLVDFPAKKIFRLLTENYFEIQTTRIDDRLSFNVVCRKGEIRLQAIETFDTFKKMFVHETSRTILYPILSQIVALFLKRENSSPSLKDKKQLKEIFSLLSPEDQLRLKDGFGRSLNNDVDSNDNILGSSLFAQAVRSVFPEAVAMQKQLEELNTKLKKDDNYIVPLDGEIPGIDAETPLKELLRKTLFINKRIILLGEAGSGKSVFLMSYVRDLLKNYSLGDPLPFYIALGKTRKQNEIILERLQRFNLKMCEVKQLNTLWFLDGYDELICQDRERLFNIFTGNHLHELPKAKFVFSCRNIFRSYEPNFYFAPIGKTVVQMDVCSLSNSKITFFFKKYVSSNPKWSLEDYQKCIHGLGLQDLVKRPFNLRCAADNLPLLQKNILKRGRREFFFPGLWICSTIWREFHKIKKTNIPKKPKDYLEYLLNVARLMKLCGVRAVASEFSEAQKDASISIQAAILAYDKQIRTIENGKENFQKEIENQESDNSTQKRLCALEEEIKKYKLLKSKICYATKELYTLLFDKQSAPWQTMAIITTMRGRAEFVYPCIYDYLVELGNDPQSERLLFEQLNSFKTLELLE